MLNLEKTVHIFSLKNLKDYNFGGDRFETYKSRLKKS